MQKIRPDRKVTEEELKLKNLKDCKLCGCVYMCEVIRVGRDCKGIRKACPCCNCVRI